VAYHSGWRVPWWPTSLSADAHAQSDDADALASKLLRVDNLLAELDNKIEQEEMEAKEALRIRRLSGGASEGGAHTSRSSIEPANGESASADSSDTAAGHSNGGEEVLKKLLPHFHRGSYSLNQDGQLVLSQPVKSLKPADSGKNLVEDEEVTSGGGMIYEGEKMKEKSAVEVEIEALLPWLAFASSDAPMPPQQHQQDMTRPTQLALVKSDSQHEEEQVEVEEEDVEEEVAEEANLWCDSWGVDMLFLFEMFPDVDPSSIHAQLVECGDDMQKVADVLLQSQSEFANQLNSSKSMNANICVGDDDLLQYDFGFQLEDEAQRIEQEQLDHQIATDFQLAFDMDDAQDSPAAATPANKQSSRFWASTVDGQGSVSVGVKQRQRQMQQQIGVNFVRGARQPRAAPVRDSQWNSDAQQGSSLSERLLLRQLDDLCREFPSAGQATVEDVWMGCQRDVNVARQNLGQMTGDESFAGGHALHDLSLAVQHDSAQGYRYRDQGFPEDGDMEENEDAENDFYDDSECKAGTRVRGGARRRRMRDEWKMVEKNTRGGGELMVWNERDDALEDRIMAELGGAGIAGQDLLEMVRYKEVQWRQEVCVRARERVHTRKRTRELERTRNEPLFRESPTKIGFTAEGPHKINLQANEWEQERARDGDCCSVTMGWRRRVGTPNYQAS